MESYAKIVCVALLASMTLTACGNGGNTTNNVSTTTVGDELAALEKAYADGILSEKEYKQQREKILKKK